MTGGSETLGASVVTAVHTRWRRVRGNRSARSGARGSRRRTKGWGAVAACRAAFDSPRSRAELRRWWQQGESMWDRGRARVGAAPAVRAGAQTAQSSALAAVAVLAGSVAGIRHDVSNDVAQAGARQQERDRRQQAAESCEANAQHPHRSPASGPRAAHDDVRGRQREAAVQHGGSPSCAGPGTSSMLPGAVGPES